MAEADAIQRLNAALEGRYRIERELGEGGMAKVYLAGDLKHERKVALKVLKPELAAVVGADRFLAEIKTTANLQHPHILGLHDSGEADGLLYYVMPYVEGESLRDRLDRENQLPVDDAVGITTNLAEALDYAHRQGVVHRDIKPGNVLLQDGKPVISDFGIALAVDAAGGGRLTETGLSLGTPHYMSPEQATGDLNVGTQTDIYALGCVLYEMLVGDPPYTGSTAQAILGKIIQAQPVSATEVRKSVPANVDAAVRKALEKLPADRFTGARDFANALADGGFRHGGPAEAGVGLASKRLWNPLSMGLAATSVILAALLLSTATRPEPVQPVTRLSLRLEDNQFPTEWLSLSPDGSTMVMSYPDDDGIWRLWVRKWGDLQVTAVPGVEKTGTAPNDPVISPDGQEVAYFDDGVLKVAPLAGGLVRTLSEGNCCARWERDGHVYFRAASGIIQRVPALGGRVEDVTSREEGEASHKYFHLLPGEEVGIFSVGSSPPRIEALRLSTGERRQITMGTRSYFTSTGHLVFGTLDGRLVAAPFDPEALELGGAPVPVVDGIHIRTDDPSYTLSENGTLAYWRAQAPRERARFVSISLDGAVTSLGSGMTFEPGTGNPGWALSPDGRRMAYRDVSGGDDGEIWITDLASGQISRLTFDAGADWAPRWSDDGSRVYFLSTRGSPDGTRRLWSRAADGTGDARLEVDTERSMAEFALSPDERWVVFRAGGPPSRDLMIKRLGEEGPEAPLVTSPDADELQPDISPDGRWLAYASDETGVTQIYVRPFPDVQSGRWQVTSGSGFAVAPRWSRDGARLFYWTDDLMSVGVDTSNGFSVGTPVDHFPFLATPGLIGSTIVGGIYDIGVDDQSVVMARMLSFSSDSGEPELILVQNFFQELERRVPN